MQSALCVPLTPPYIIINQRLEFPMDLRYKPRLVKALLRLSRASGLYPKCLALKSIEMEAHPVDHGSYGDVYKGVLHSQKIAVKALRVYQTSDLVKLLKVGVEFGLFVDLI